MGCTGSKHDDDPPVKSNAKSKTENEQSVRNVAHQNNRTSLEKKVEPITASVTAPVVPKDSPIKADAKIKPLTFKEVMEDKEGRAYFMKFLQGEHAEENLVFFEEVENIKSSPRTDLQKNVQELASAFLKPGVESEVNVSDNMKKNILVLSNDDTNYKQGELVGYLEKAQNEILMIMAMGSYPRFVKSKLYADFISKKKTEVRKVEKV